MFRLTIKDKRLHWIDSGRTYDTIETEHHYNCGSIEQLMGLLQFMVATSEKELDCTISILEEGDE